MIQILKKEGFMEYSWIKETVLANLSRSSFCSLKAINIWGEREWPSAHTVDASAQTPEEGFAISLSPAQGRHCSFPVCLSLWNLWHGHASSTAHIDSGLRTLKASLTFYGGTCAQ